jgi:hypothetical protein
MVELAVGSVIAIIVVKNIKALQVVVLGFALAALSKPLASCLFVAVVSIVHSSARHRSLVLTDAVHGTIEPLAAVGQVTLHYIRDGGAGAADCEMRVGHLESDLQTVHRRHRGHTL